ncbi:hypothetical protein MHYP_G00006480 [Metynnis hypsauchen]
MAPVFGSAAASLWVSVPHLSRLFVVFCLVSSVFLCARNISAALVYDRQMLLQIGNSVQSLCNTEGNFMFPGSAVYSPFHVSLLCEFGDKPKSLRKKRRMRKRGSRAGLQVKLRRLWNQNRAPGFQCCFPSTTLPMTGYPASSRWRECCAGCRRCDHVRTSYLRVVCPEAYSVSVDLHCPRRCSGRVSDRGGKRVLRQLPRAPTTSNIRNLSTLTTCAQQTVLLLGLRGGLGVVEGSRWSGKTTMLAS